MSCLYLSISFLYISKHCSISAWTVRAADAFSPHYTNFQSSFRTIKQNKSLLLVTNNDCLILLAPKKSSQVVWFHSTSIFQRLFFCYLLKCVAIYFQCYAFHGASIYSAFHEASNRGDYRTVQWNSLGPSFQSVLGRNKCMCYSSHVLCYGCVRSCVIHNSFASYDADVICACRANMADRQWTQTLSNLII